MSEEMQPAVRVEKAGPVTTVILNRPHARNAVDGPTAAALLAAFTEFDADPEASVAVLWGDNGTFCAGADLKAMGSDRGNELHPHGPGPMGPSRLRLSKPVIAAISGTPSPAGSSSPCGATFGWSRRTPCWVCSAGVGAFRSSTVARSGCRG